MRRLASLLTVAALAAAAPAASADTGGTGAPAAPVAAGKVGGAAFSSARVRSVTRLSARSSAHPSIHVRFATSGLRFVDASVVVLRASGRVAARITLRHVRANRLIAVRWPSRVALAAGRYVVRARAGGVARRTVLVVARPRPRPRRPAPPPRPTARGVFPVAGPHSYGDPFGAPRKGYTHQGQDIVGAEGTPIVAPLAGTISTTGYQASAAGYYVVLDASDGHAYFFAHCQKGSTAVSPGAVVAAGAPICAMGHTGDASGPHLHFEEWVGGWRVDAGSHPVDPLPQLRAWDS